MAYLATRPNRFVYVHTPKHGSWLNMVEIELAILVRQCLGQRLPDIPTFQEEVTAWQERRNARRTHFA